MKTNTTKQTIDQSADVAVLTETFKNDIKTSVLVVSVMTNLFVLTAWLVVQSTNSYDAQLMSALFVR